MSGDFVNSPSRYVGFWALNLLLILMMIYNFQQSALRLVAVVLIILLPFLLLSGGRLTRLFAVYMALSIASMAYLVFSILGNVSTFELDISGASAEIFSAFVGVSLLPVMYLLRTDLLRNVGRERVFKYFISVYLVVLCADVVVRYGLEPQCFLNYSCRHEAKTVGFFSTTNVTGMNVATLLMAIIASGHAGGNRLLASLLAVILVTTMARAAIISFITVFVIYRLVASAFLTKALIGVLVFSGFYYLAADNFYGILTDGSLLSKFDFVSSAYVLGHNASLSQLLFGFGSSFSEVVAILNVNGWSPHLPLLKAFLYFGTIGVGLYLLSMLVLLKFGGRGFFWALLVNQVAAMAGGPMYSPSLAAVCFVSVILTQGAYKQKSGLSSCQI